MRLGYGIFNIPRSTNIPVFIDSEDEIGMNIKSYISTIRVGDRVIPSIDYLSDSSILSSAIRATTPFSVWSDEHRNIYHNTITWSSAVWLPELEPIATVMLESGALHFWLREHVEQSIELLFGDVVLEDMRRSDGDQHLNELTGVYFNPPRGGGGGRNYSVVLCYEDLGERYRAVVVYISLCPFTDYYWRTPRPNSNLEHTEIVYMRDENVADALMAHVQDPTNQFHMYLLKQGDGSLLFERQVPVS